MPDDVKPAPPTTMVIFGATGDLSRRKLLPALCRLRTLGMLPEKGFDIVGFSSRKLTERGFRKFAREAIEGALEPPRPPESADAAKSIDWLIRRSHFISSKFDDPDGYARLSEKLSSMDEKSGDPATRIFYLATPPTFFSPIVEMLDRAGLAGKTRKRHGAARPRIIIEKPFGRDLASARALNRLLLKRFIEEQVYRIDHYLGKETVQNLLFFRFANGIYEPIWNRRYIDHVQITVAEKDGVGGRGKYFEEAGSLRDMVQNHMLQLLALFAMEPPISMEARVIQAKKTELLQSLRQIEPADARIYTARGQYGGGGVDGGESPMYRAEAFVSPDSNVETFVALKLFIDNWRWSGVPFYLRTGKRLRKRATEIAIHFRAVPHCLFTKSISGCPVSNVLELKIQPDEGIRFSFNIKYPGSARRMDTVEMDFSYGEAYAVELPEAYERLLYDCMVGDSTLFPQREGIEASWEFITNILRGWEELPPPEFPNYAPGSWGPEEADRLIRMDGRQWKEP